MDRKTLVTRHNITFTTANSADIPQVGNGEIAFGIDVTGLQTLYGNTLSQWGWHSTVPPVKNPVEAFKMFEIEVHGHIATYPASAAGQEELFSWLRENPHRLNLGKIAFLLDGKHVEEKHLTDICQTLDLWRGVITSNYSLAGVPVTVTTACHPKLDMLIAEVRSPLIKAKRLAIEIAFPYGHATEKSGADWNAHERHSTDVLTTEQSALFKRKLDEDRYETSLVWEAKASIEKLAEHLYTLQPAGESESFSFVCRFAPKIDDTPTVKFEKALTVTMAHWEKFWTSGGAIDLSGSSDPRWKELERRIVLSQYLLAVNEAGSLPPQESGLLNNSGWYGKFHLEMHWWHGAHYQLWNRWELFERSLGWYRDTLPVARGIAKRQGYCGGRWPKMIGPDGRFGPSVCGPWLIWQQPHPIFYAEQNYRLHPTPETLDKWKDVVFETAEFMASYAHKNEDTGKYDLGPWVINAAENNLDVKHITINPAFELSYWRYGLRVACVWRERMGLPEKADWKSVIANLAPLPVENGVYVMWEGVPDMWTKYNCGHPDVIGTGAFLPNEGVDINTLQNTVDKVFKQWNMYSTWGWDFPWLAMAAARAGKPQQALDALFLEAAHKNNFNVCGVNMGGPAHTYFPGNGGLLYVVAMMAAGWDGGPDRDAPGFPDDGTWVVRHEGLMKAQ